MKKHGRLLSVLILLLAGCSATLETGYEPRKLGASDAVRRGYYAAPYTPEARAAGSERDQDIDTRHPHPGM